MVATIKKGSVHKANRSATHVKNKQSQSEQADKKSSGKMEAGVTRTSSKAVSKRDALSEISVKLEGERSVTHSSPEHEHEVAHRRGSSRAKLASVKRKLVEAKKEQQLCDDSKRVDTSCITEDGVAKIPEPFDVPMASSPVNTPRMLSNIGDGDTMAGDQSNVAANETKGSTKSHRGIVAEMYAHERRQARVSASTASKTMNGITTGLLNPLHAAATFPNIPPISSTTYYPYGVPAIPPAEPILSPFGISPYAEPGSSWTTNVYVNNLPPHTTDEDLLRLGSCFGKIKSHKAIINQETGLCKGYGFLMYEFLHDAELALQQLPLHGLSTSWAKESFSSKLRRMADSTTSNIYLSNLPNDITTVQLEQMFSPHQVISLRILTDANTGKPRGVGFVRLRDRAAAQDCIERLNGLVIPGQDSTLQVRFADSEAQKSFKMCARAQLSKADDSRPSLEAQNSESSLVSANVSGKTGTANTLNGTPQQIFLAALQGQHTWTGFPTPVVTNTGNFSPLLGVGGAGVHPQLAEHDALMQQIGLQQHYDTKEIPFGMPMPFVDASHCHRQAFEAMDPTALQRLQWLTNVQATAHLPPTSIGRVASTTAPAVLSQKTGGVNGVRATYLPPELAMQHARALMEKKAETAGGAPSSRANVVAKTEQHIEKERTDLLKLLQSTTLKGDAANDTHAKARTGRSYSASASKTTPDRGVMHVLATDIRPSVSANALSPVQFMRSQDHILSPSPSTVDGASDVYKYGQEEQAINDHPTIAATDMPDETAYTSSANTSNVDDSQRGSSSSNVSAVSMHKSDSGKNFDCGGLDVYGDRRAADVPVDAKPLTVHEARPKGRSRSKSVLLHLPLTEIVEATTQQPNP